MKPSDLAKLAVGLTAGTIAADAIEEEFGSNILSQVTAIAGGSIVGSVASKAMDNFGVSEVIDDCVSGVLDLF